MKALIVIAFVTLNPFRSFCQFDDAFDGFISILCANENDSILLREAYLVNNRKVYLFVNDQLIKHIDDYEEFHRISSIQDDKTFTISKCESKQVKLVFDPFYSQIYYKGGINSIIVINKLSTRESEFIFSITTISSKKIQSFPYTRYYVNFSMEDLKINSIKKMKSGFINVLD